MGGPGSGKRPAMYVLGVTGSRGWYDRKAVATYVGRWAADNPGKTPLLVHGGAKGVDAQAANAAEALGIHTARVDALWPFHGRPAGPIRNQTMVELVRALGGRMVAFWDGESRGTRSTIILARELGVEITVFGSLGEGRL